jgi:hypothetical protein
MVLKGRTFYSNFGYLQNWVGKQEFDKASSKEVSIFGEKGGQQEDPPLLVYGS